MTGKKTWGSTVLGWFVVNEEGESAPTDAGSTESVADRETDAAAAFVKEIPASPGGRVDFAAVYEAAGIGAEEQARVAKASELLKTLPDGTEASVKKKIVEASLKTFGVPIDKIIEAAAGEVQALEGYIRAGGADTQKLLEESRGRIADVEAEISRIKSVMEQRVVEQQVVTKACNDKKLEIQGVLEFFGQEAVARVVRESPRLIEPTTPSH
jgi:hypothetical protein